MEKKLKSPRITDFSWGHLVVDNRTSYRDAKLFPGGSRKWDWKETGTGHSPGIQPADVSELLDHGSTVVVLSRGVQNALGVQADTIEMLQKKESRSMSIKPRRQFASKMICGKASPWAGFFIRPARIVLVEKRVAS